MARWQRLGDNHNFPCTHKSDVQINCNGTTFRVRDNNTIEHGITTGTYDGYKSISWTNGARWYKQGNDKYYCKYVMFN